MTRPLDTATAAALEKSVIPMASIVRLDIANDPLYCWSGIGDLVFAAGATGDSALDGVTFAGVGTLIEMGSVSDSIGGSDALEVRMSGVSLDDPLLRQMVRDRQRWQFRKAYVWLMIMDPDTNAIVGKPFRVKTGRIDQMPFNDGDAPYIGVKIEGQQAYGNEPLATRYSEQPAINSNDNSQSWVLSLSNMTAALGQPNAVPSQPSSPGGEAGNLGAALLPA